MKKVFLFLLLAGLILLTGCARANLFETEYSYSEPFAYSISRGGGGATEIGNYNMLKSALVDMINSHEESGVFRFSRYNGSVADDLAGACLEVRTENPLGAYAVETLTFDTSRIVSYYTADIQATYKKTAEEIRGIEGITSIAELRDRLRGAVTVCEEGLVLRVYSAQVDEEYLVALVEEFHLSDPVTVVTEPLVEIDSYPNEGINRIYDIHLDYGAAPERIAELSRQLSARVRELAEILETGAEDETKPRMALDSAGLLYGLLTEEKGSWAGTAYGAILEHAADSKGIALGYKALCDALGIECLVVQGNIGHIGTEEHYWNIIGLEGGYYHVDVSAFGGDRRQAFLLDDDSLWGTYLWDTETYPACAGGLRYEDVAPEDPLPEETVQMEAPEWRDPKDDEVPPAEPQEGHIPPAEPRETEEPPAGTEASEETQPQETEETEIPEKNEDSDEIVS